MAFGGYSRGQGQVFVRLANYRPRLFSFAFLVSSLPLLPFVDPPLPPPLFCDSFQNGRSLRNTDSPSILVFQRAHVFNALALPQTVDRARAVDAKVRSYLSSNILPARSPDFLGTRASYR